MTEQDHFGKNAPEKGRIADIVNAKIETHRMAPIEYKNFLLGKLAVGEERDERVAAEAEHELEALHELYPYLREDTTN